MRTPPKTPTEHEMQCYAFDVLRLNEKRYPVLKWVHASMNGVWSSSPKTAAARRRSGQTAGVSDVCVPIASKGFHGAYIELKRKPNKMTPEQSEFAAFVTGQGYYFKAVWSGEELLDAVEEYLGVRLSR